jgi:putative ABC transport system substrate-binding protein
MITRRTFIGAMAGGLLAAPLAAEAQKAGRIPKIAFITTTAPGGSPTTDAFRGGLRDLGYVEGQNIVVEWRWGRGTTERFAEFAAEVVGLKVDVIVAANSPAGHAAQKATRTIPIVIPTMADPVGDGFVTTVARPGGNITGFTFQLPELQGKRLQLFKETVPSVSRIALLVDSSDRNHRSLAEEAEIAARTLGTQLQPVVEARTPNEINNAFATFTRTSPRAVFIVGGTMFYANRAQLAKQALDHHLPMMCEAREHAEAGCLISYAANLGDLFRRAAGLVDRLLKGAKPADLPVEQPTKFDLVINLKTAKALGLTIPPSLLGRADEVIQ